MNFNEYIDDVRSDGFNFIDENVDDYRTFDNIWYDMTLTITGNDNGSYYCNSARAKEELAGIIWDDEFYKSLRFYEYYETLPLEEGPEICDVVVRLLCCDMLYCEFEDYFHSKKRLD